MNVGQHDHVSVNNLSPCNDIGQQIRIMVKYFSRYLITTVKQAVKMEPIKYMGEYMPICRILPCAEIVIYRWQNSIFIIYINTFQRK